MSLSYLNSYADWNIDKRREYIKSFASVKGDSYDIYLKMFYHAEPDAAVREHILSELQRRGTAPESPDFRSENLTCRSLTKEESLTIPNLFLLDPTTNDYLQGNASRTKPKSGFAYFPAFIMLSLIALFFGFITVRDYLTLRQIQESGITAQAEVTELKRIPGRNTRGSSTSTTYSVTYQFTDATGQQHTGTTGIDFDLYRSLQLGAPIDITYVPSDPSVSRVKGTAPALLGSAAGTGMFVVLALFTLFSHRSQRKEHHRLSDSGQLLQAQIIETVGYKSKGGYEVAIGYGCRLPDGKVLWGIETLVRNDMKNQPGPPAGTPVILEYADMKHLELL